MRTPVENHDLVPSLSHNIESQAHSRVPECDGRPAVQVESGLLSVSPIPDPKAWDIDALNINWMGLTTYASLPTTLLLKVIQKSGNAIA